MFSCLGIQRPQYKELSCSNTALCSYDVPIRAKVYTLIGFSISDETNVTE